MALSFRAAEAADIPRLAQAEADAHTAATPWTEGNFRDALAAGYRLLLAEDGNVLRGYAVASRVLDEAELLTIGVPRTAQRQGIGAALLAHLIAELRAAGIARLFLEVRAGNLPAHNLYRRAGFAEIGRRRGYYAIPDSGEREDALTMARELRDDGHG